MTGWNGWTWYWLVWAVTTFVAFGVPEGIALATGHSENTLSAQVWRIEGFLPGQGAIHWTAVHYLFGGMILVVLTWLCFHFVLGLFR